MNHQDAINHLLKDVFPRATTRPATELFPDAVEAFFDAIRAYNEWTIYRRIERKEQHHTSETLRAIFHWDIGCARMDPAAVNDDTRAPREWENFANAKILTQWAKGKVTSTGELFPTRSAAENQLKEFAECAKIVFKRARDHPRRNGEFPHSGLNISDAVIDDAVKDLLNQIEDCNALKWKRSDERATKAASKRRAEARKHAEIANERNINAGKPAVTEHPAAKKAEDALAPKQSFVHSVASAVSEPAALITAPDPAWLIALREDNSLVVTEEKDGKRIHVASTEFPHLGIDIKKGATEEEAKKLGDVLRAHTVCHRENEEYIKALCDFGFRVEEAKGTRFLCHIEAGVRAELKGTPLEQVNIIDAAEAQWFAYTNSPEVAAELQAEAGTPPAPNGELPNGKANGTKNGNGRKHAEYDYRPWQPDPNDTFIIFDANTLRKLCTPSGINERTFLDILRFTAKLPGVKVIIPDVIANWELQGRVPTYDDHGSFTGYETVHRAVNSIHHLKHTAGVMKGLFESAAHGRVTSDHRIELAKGKNSNIIIMRTPKDASLYHEIRTIADETSTRAEEVERLRDEIFGHNFGEKAVTEIVKGAGIPNPMMIVSDDLQYFNTSAPSSTRAGNPVGHCSTLHYLGAQLSPLTSQEIMSMLRMQQGDTQTVPDDQKVKSVILDFKKQHSRTPETMETMFPNHTSRGQYRDQPRRGVDDIYKLISRCVQTQREHAEAKRANGNGVDENGMHQEHPAEETPPPPTSNGWAGERVAVRPIVPDGVNQNRGDGWKRSQQGSAEG